HFGRTVLVEDVHIERDAGLERRKLEHALHQHGGLNRARFGLQHQANVVAAFVAYIAQEPRFLFLDQSPQLFHPFRLLNEVGDVGDDDAPHAAPEVLTLPARAHAKAAASGLIGFAYRLRRLDDDAAGWKIRPRHDFQQFGGCGFRIVYERQTTIDEL